MKQIFLSIFAMLAFCASASDAIFKYFSYKGNDAYCADTLRNPGEYYNPVISGWASDPSITRKGDDYWLVTSTFGYFPGVPLYHSRDLITWEHVSNILSRPSQLPWLQGLSLDKGGIYAASISYNPANDLFYMITTCVIKGKGLEDGSINFYVTAKDPAGEWSDPVILSGLEGIDPSFFFDDNGKAYIVYKSGEHSKVKWSNHRALSIVEFDPVSGKTVGTPQLFREKGVGPDERLDRDEGPHIIKENGKYFLIAAEGGTGSFHSEVVYRADSVFGEWERWARNPMLTQRFLKPDRPEPVTSTGHVDMVKTPSGKWYAVFLGCRPWNDGIDHLGRETFLMPVEWSSDGFPRIFHNGRETVPLRNRIDLPGIQKSGQTGNFEWTDRFDSEKLHPRWMSLRGPADSFYTTGKGLKLKSSAVDTRSSSTPAYLGARMQHHSFEAETELRFNPENDKEAAGLLMLKNETRQYFLALTAKGIVLYKIDAKAFTPLAEATIPVRDKEIALKVISKGSAYDFYYRPASSSEWTLLATDIPASHISTQSGGFTGSTLGIASLPLPR